jgi:hypothetical protein
VTKKAQASLAVALAVLQRQTLLPPDMFFGL